MQDKLGYIRDIKSLGKDDKMAGEKGEISRREFLTDAGSVVGRAEHPAEVQIVTAPEKLTRLNVNGFTYELKVEPSWTLAHTLRDKLALTGTKIGCNMGECGACTVLIDGIPVSSCMTLAVECDGRDITTIEGLAEGPKLHPIQQAFIDNHGFQCGYCTPGQIISAKALLDKNLNPSEEEVKKALSGNLCRCGNYPKIVESVLAAAKALREG
ncbi:(2Fe-2S)-binding protein [Chloroflexota bacterium]